MTNLASKKTHNEYESERESGERKERKRRSLTTHDITIALAHFSFAFGFRLGRRGGRDF
jgi:hypothetical protein